MKIHENTSVKLRRSKWGIWITRINPKLSIAVNLEQWIPRILGKKKSTTKNEAKQSLKKQTDIGEIRSISNQKTNRYSKPNCRTEAESRTVMKCDRNKSWSQEQNKLNHKMERFINLKFDRSRIQTWKYLNRTWNWTKNWT